MVSGLLGQFPRYPDHAVAGIAVYLHGLAGEIAARRPSPEQTVIATDLIEYLAEGIRAITNVPHAL